MAKKKVLITGAAGRIGRVLREGLRDRYDIRILFNRTVTETTPDEEVFQANVTDLGKERWVLWQGRLRTDARLIGSTVLAHVEVWSVLSGEVNLNDAFSQGQGLEGGLEVKLFGDFWGGLGYRFDRATLRDDVRTDVTERLYLRFGWGTF